MWSGLLIEAAKLPHYIAGGVGLLPLMAAYGCRWLRVSAREYGPLIVLTLAALICLQGRGSDQGRPWEVRREPPPQTAAARLIAPEGNHLILVRHSSGYVEGSDEVVYNSANIDAARIVWARDMGETKNRELIDYYKGNRTVWLYQADTNPPRLARYDPENGFSSRFSCRPPGGEASTDRGCEQHNLRSDTTWP